MKVFEVGESKLPRPGAPDWEEVWPVMVNGSEVAEIVELERGYRLREGGEWVAPMRPFRSQAEDDARNRHLAWVTQNSHPASGLRYQEAAYNDDRTLGRITLDNVTVVFGPGEADAAYAEYNRRYINYINKIEEKNA